MNWCDKVNAVKFTFDDAWRFHGRLGKAENPPTSAQEALAFATQFFNGDKVKAVAFSLRMDALVALFEDDDRIEAWTMPLQSDGSAALQEPVFYAIAHCPLHLMDGKMRFDGDEFFGMILQSSYQAGAA